LIFIFHLSFQPLTGFFPIRRNARSLKLKKIKLSLGPPSRVRRRTERKKIHMATEKQIHANQENAKHSTGPSEAGKANSAGNNFKHGLCPTEGFFILLPGEPQEEYLDLKNTLSSQFNPETPTEIILVQRMAESEWLRARAVMFQSKALYVDEGKEAAAKLSLYMRYATTHERSFYKALNELTKLRKEKEKSEIGFKSQERKQAAAIRAVERQNLTREALAFKKDELSFKKEVYQAKKSPAQAPKAPADDLKMAA
jgi:hypothetical protein